ncbi:hypothetical protein CONPUDRAFT_73872 [Coniophora puteana RWD-64-598 SS2]|uniref:Uncharacterized protein n=1 Tax=Coniophora puteana (strain RWD-64-598) TaxID=741705 RepID=A0A5M3MP87_CONPW|nr:uncharacterized protein CONPUDRAFT_73872 [Coniophora puteana RWD-64-598 SS2]EIW80857.1 hypothetical protein CONPUDRAFT_73872 [Coniophora puteana RWD-64-598 SS2]
MSTPCLDSEDASQGPALLARESDPFILNDVQEIIYNDLALESEALGDEEPEIQGAQSHKKRRKAAVSTKNKAYWAPLIQSANNAVAASLRPANSITDQGKCSRWISKYHGEAQSALLAAIALTCGILPRAFQLSKLLHHNHAASSRKKNLFLLNDSSLVLANPPAKQYTKDTQSCLWSLPDELKKPMLLFLEQSKQCTEAQIADYAPYIFFKAESRHRNTRNPSLWRSEAVAFPNLFQISVEAPLSAIDTQVLWSNIYRFPNVGPNTPTSNPYEVSKGFQAFYGLASVEKLSANVLDCCGFLPSSLCIAPMVLQVARESVVCLHLLDSPASSSLWAATQGKNIARCNAIANMCSQCVKLITHGFSITGITNLTMHYFYYETAIVLVFGVKLIG